jgi:GTPase SAR1 family protein
MFGEQQLATIGVDFRMKKYKFKNVEVKAQIWDTAGQERFRSIQRPYYKGILYKSIKFIGAGAILLCFDLND